MKVLFIGNSHTYYNGMPFQFLSLARAGGEDPVVAMLTTGGMSLEWHAEQVQVQQNILYGDWTHVVLQQVTHPFAGAEVLSRDVGRLMEWIGRTSAKPVLYMTWASRKEPQHQAEIADAFRSVGARFGALVAPVGVAWRNTLQLAPEIELFDMDGEHASPAGSYLAACVFHGTLLSKSPVGLPGELVRGGTSLVSLEPCAKAELLQQIAWKAVTS